jgi:hypothetical protein
VGVGVAIPFVDDIVVVVVLVVALAVVMVPTIATQT